MNYDKARTRLGNHSNLGDTGPREESFLHHLWQADREGTVERLDALVIDVIQCLAVANLERIRQYAREESQPVRSTVMDDLAYPVAGIIAGGLKYHAKWSKDLTVPDAQLDALRDGVYKIAVAWDLLLAGDIDDLQGAVETEVWATIR